MPRFLRRMAFLLRPGWIALALVVIAVAAGLGWLAFWDIPAPNTPIERVIPDARFPK